jgi:16S rRNA (cytidine1402-2'-O)-methyltransferase
MVSVLGPRRACLARELTKVHEEWLHGRLNEILEIVRSRSRIQGEITIVVDRGERALGPVTYPASLREHLEQEKRATGASDKAALKSVARQRGITRREAYRLLLTERSA